jgi:hypothetical protein
VVAAIVLFELASAGGTMTNDPYLSKAPAAPPNEADYDAAYAEIMATARGRRFLIEYAIRNRHPDSHILVSTIARLEAALRDPSRQVPAAFKRDLTELAAAIARIEAMGTVGGVPVAASVPAAERITEIVLALRDVALRVDAMIALAAAADAGAIAATDATSPVPLGPPLPFPRATPNDLLAVLRALSDEELIALFS